ncbi:MAG: hypothetical protein WC623_13540 [Pedobacter sp.]|uniref:hypothetical protein n=1 Tax=Pedobacter sp. TaxID=1411316 RepID=UPI0035627AD9
MKTQRKTKITNEQFQIINQKVESIYTLIVSNAIDLLKNLKSFELRTYCEMEHTKNDLNANLIREFLCQFWNITLTESPKDHRYCIIIDLSKEALKKYGSDLTNTLILKIYSVICSNEETTDILYSVKINFMPIELLNYFNSTIAQGETNYISITTIEASLSLKDECKSHYLY